MSVIPKPDWQAFECPHCPEPFTAEEWMSVDLVHFDGDTPTHAQCCTRLECKQIADHDAAIRKVG